MNKKQKIVDKCIEYFQGDTLAANVWLDKYALKTKDGELLESTPDDMFERLASEFSRIESMYPNGVSNREILELLKDFKYIIPGGSILYGVGNDHSFSSLGNCFVIGNGEDSYGGIMKTDEEQVQLMKRRAGVGLDLSHIRPKGSPTSNAAHTSTGVVPFMQRYSNTTLEVAQDGRRGALMETIDVDHPDIFEFLSAKEDKTKITGANISIKVSNDFMKAVLADSTFPLKYKGKVYKEVKAFQLFDKIAEHAWKDAEPGVIYIDSIRENSPADCYEGFNTISTNPCKNYYKIVA